MSYNEQALRWNVNSAGQWSRDDYPQGGCRKARPLNILLIEIILDRYVAKAQKRQKDWSPAEVEELLLKLREKVLDSLR